MNPLKPGYQSTEFYIALAAQILAVLTLTGVISQEEAKGLEDSITKCITAVFLFAANAWIVVEYIRRRTQLKTMNTEPPEPPKDAKLPLKLVGLFVIGFFGMGALATPANAQSMLPWRNQIEQRLKDQNHLIGQLIVAQRQQQSPPQPIPIAIAPMQPYQLLPIAGEPKQQLPIQGEPKQALPIQGQPLQPLPIPGSPLEPLPIPGAPRQDLPQRYTGIIQRTLAVLD